MSTKASPCTDSKSKETEKSNRRQKDRHHDETLPQLKDIPCRIHS